MVMQRLKDQMICVVSKDSFLYPLNIVLDGPVMKHLDPTFDGTLKLCIL